MDFKDLDDAIKEAKSVAVVGGGFLGSELACALGHRGLVSKDRIVLNTVLFAKFNFYQMKDNLVWQHLLLHTMSKKLLYMFCLFSY